MIKYLMIILAVVFLLIPSSVNSEPIWDSDNNALDMNGSKLIDLPTPLADDEAATKKYADDINTAVTDQSYVQVEPDPGVSDSYVDIIINWTGSIVNTIGSALDAISFNVNLLLGRYHPESVYVQLSDFIGATDPCSGFEAAALPALVVTGRDLERHIHVYGTGTVDDLTDMNIRGADEYRVCWLLVAGDDGDVDGYPDDTDASINFQHKFFIHFHDARLEYTDTAAQDMPIAMFQVGNGYRIGWKEDPDNPATASNSVAGSLNDFVMDGTLTIDQGGTTDQWTDGHIPATNFALATHGSNTTGIAFWETGAIRMDTSELKLFLEGNANDHDNIGYLDSHGGWGNNHGYMVAKNNEVGM